jgi:iron complex transport system permease protein
VIRLVSGFDHRTLLPAAALAGGSLIVVADTVARTIIAPQQLPVGAIMAVLGVPVFIGSVTPYRKFGVLTGDRHQPD